MAGKRQHHIPRFLLKGFASRFNRDRVFTNVFRKSGPPFESNIEKIHVAKFFYGKPSESDADAVITDREEEYVTFIQELRSHCKSTPIDSVKSTRFVGHLLLRSKGIRQSTTAYMNQFHQIFQKRISSEEQIYWLLKTAIDQNRKKMADQIRGKLPLLLNKSERMLITKRLLDNPRMIFDYLPENAKTDFREKCDNFLGEFGAVIKNSQLKALTLVDTNEKLLEVGEQFLWQLVYSADSNFILGDVPVIGR